MTGRITIRIAYGEPIWEAFGEELVALNAEAADLLNNSFNTFWFVDVFHFRKSIQNLNVLIVLIFRSTFCSYMVSWCTFQVGTIDYSWYPCLYNAHGQLLTRSYIDESPLVVESIPPRYETGHGIG